MLKNLDALAVEAAQVDPDTEGTFRFRYIEVGRLVDGSFRSILESARSAGAQVLYTRQAGLFEVVYTGLEIRGRASTLRWVAQNLRTLLQHQSGCNLQARG